MLVLENTFFMLFNAFKEDIDGLNNPSTRLIPWKLWSFLVSRPLIYETLDKNIRLVHILILYNYNIILILLYSLDHVENPVTVTSFKVIILNRIFYIKKHCFEQKWNLFSNCFKVSTFGSVILYLQSFFSLFGVKHPMTKRSVAPCILYNACISKEVK